jgi:hypothetical protein
VIWGGCARDDLLDPVLLGVNHHQHLRLKVVPDRGDEHIDLTEPMRLERIFVGGVKFNG